MVRSNKTISPVWEKDYQRHLQALTLDRLRVVLLLAIFIFILDGAVQHILKTALFYNIFWVRIAAFLASLCLLGFSYWGSASRLAFALSLITILIVAGPCEAAIVVSGGYNSSFQTGLTLLLIAVGLFFPYSLTQMILACVLIWGIYLAPALGAGQGLKLNGSGFYVNAFFLICASVIAVTASYLTSRLRQQEFFSRQALQEEQAKSERLLLNILPEPIARRLMDGEEQISDSFDEVTVLFADIVGFTSFSAQLHPTALIVLLNELFSRFDKLTGKYKVEKIKTIGDAYMVVGGVPLSKKNHAEAIAELALDMVEEVAHFSKEAEIPLDIRIGINTGPAVAGVIGQKKFIYDLWGDTVNTASRMESHGIVGRIQVAEKSYNRLRQNYKFIERGVINIKGKGNMQTYLLDGRK